MPQGFARLLISGAPRRIPAPRPGQKLITDANFVPTPALESPDGFQQLEAEIALAEERLALMKSRLVTLRARAKKKRNSMATVERVRPQSVRQR